MDSGSHSWSVELGFWMQSSVGFRIPRAVFLIPKPYIPGFHKQNFLVFRIWIPQAQISGISETGFPYMVRYWATSLSSSYNNSEYGSTVVQLVKSSENGRSRESASKKPGGWLIYDVVVNLKTLLKFKASSDPTWLKNLQIMLTFTTTLKTCLDLEIFRLL